MDKFKGTPGPWSVNVIGQHWNNKSLKHIEVTFGEDGECICDTVYSPDDAQLIAAAPDLLEALQKLRVYAEDVCGACPDDCHEEHPLMMASYVIDKALGK